MQTLPQSQGGATAALAEFEHKDQVRGVLRAFLALRHRNFRLFWTGQLISLIGTWMRPGRSAAIFTRIDTLTLWWCAGRPPAEAHGAAFHPIIRNAPGVRALDTRRYW